MASSPPAVSPSVARTPNAIPVATEPTQASHANFCLGQIIVDDKSNEIPAVEELLGILNLKGAIVTAGAMHCQKEAAKRIIEK